MGWGQITGGSVCQAGEPERAWKQGGRMVGPEIPPAAHAALVKGGRAKAGGPQWKPIFLTWLYFLKITIYAF